MILGSILNYYGIFQIRKYTFSEFKIVDIKSNVDFNNNGIDASHLGTGNGYSVLELVEAFK